MHLRRITISGFKCSKHSCRHFKLKRSRHRNRKRRLKLQRSSSNSLRRRSPPVLRGRAGQVEHCPSMEVPAVKKCSIPISRLSVTFSAPLGLTKLIRILHCKCTNRKPRFKRSLIRTLVRTSSCHSARKEWSSKKATLHFRLSPADC